MLDNDKFLESSEPNKNRSNEKKASKGRVIAVQDALLHPKKDHSKEKKTSKGYAGTAQDIEWRRPEEPEDYSREQVYDLNGIQGEYEN